MGGSERLKNEHETMKQILGLIASGAIYGDNCRAIANTTLNELFLNQHAQARDSDNA